MLLILRSETFYYTVVFGRGTIYWELTNPVPNLMDIKDKIQNRNLALVILC